MRPPNAAAQKKLDYPEETPGSRLASKARKLANKLTRNNPGAFQWSNDDDLWRRKRSNSRSTLTLSSISPETKTSPMISGDFPEQRLRIGLAAHGGSRIARHFHSRRQQSGTGTGADGTDPVEAMGHPSL